MTSIPTPYPISPKLSEAARERGIALLGELLEKFGTSPAKDRWGAHPLHLAGITGNVEALCLLLEHGAPVDTRLEADLSYSDDRHLAPVGSGGSYKSVQFSAGSGVLDVIALMRRHLETQLDLARTEAALAHGHARARATEPVARRALDHVMLPSAQR